MCCQALRLLFSYTLGREWWEGRTVACRLHFIFTWEPNIVDVRQSFCKAVILAACLICLIFPAVWTSNVKGQRVCTLLILANSQAHPYIQVPDSPKQPLTRYMQVMHPSLDFLVSNRRVTSVVSRPHCSELVISGAGRVSSPAYHSCLPRRD